MTTPDNQRPENPDTQADTSVSYAAAGVDIEAGDKAVELFAPHAKLSLMHI